MLYNIVIEHLFASDVVFAIPSLTPKCTTKGPFKALNR